MEKKTRIYFDMDGVLADFDRGVREICGVTPPSQNAGHRSPKEDDDMWDRSRKHGHFYDSLELMPGAKQMFDLLYDRYGNGCEILTGIPKPKRGVVNAAADKENWVRRLLSEDIRINIVFREEKPQFCTGKECILIDDMKKNIQDWNEIGGTGILHISADDTIRQLKEMNILCKQHD